MSTVPIIKSYDDLLREKKSHRRAMAAKPVEEKLETLIQLQRISSTLARQAGRPYQEPWNIELGEKAHAT
jgi:hypothetical protein